MPLISFPWLESSGDTLVASTFDWFNPVSRVAALLVIFNFWLLIMFLDSWWFLDFLIRNPSIRKSKNHRIFILESKQQTHFTITMKCVLFLNLKFPDTLVSEPWIRSGRSMVSCYSLSTPVKDDGCSRHRLRKHLDSIGVAIRLRTEPLHFTSVGSSWCEKNSCPLWVVEERVIWVMTFNNTVSQLFFITHNYIYR